MANQSNPPHPPAGVDVNALVASGGLRIDIKSHDLPEKLASEIRIKEEQARYERWKDFALFVAALIVVSLIILACLVIIISQKYEQQSTDSAWKVLLSLAGVGGGFIWGKSKSGDRND